MKRLLIGAAAVLFITSAAFAQEKKEKSPKAETASCCKKDKDAKACCKQPSKTASLRTKPKVMPNAKPAGK